MCLRYSIRDHSAGPHLALIIVQILFGTWPIFGKIALRSMSSVSLVGFRICGAALLHIITTKAPRAVAIAEASTGMAYPL